MTTFTLLSNDFADNNNIPIDCTCDGSSRMPAFSWSGQPTGTQSYVFLCEDPDAPGKTWIHCVLFNIPASMHSIESYAQITASGALIGKNDSNAPLWGAPCPPPTHGAHHYICSLYALDTKLLLSVGATYAEVTQAMNGHVLASAKIVGLYKRKQ
ncbi:MAG: YbhB/YbcL family Raf kinase inhibitor-like protein [Candidatus Babeliales bacterium]